MKDYLGWDLCEHCKGTGHAGTQERCPAISGLVPKRCAKPADGHTDHVSFDDGRCLGWSTPHAAAGAR